MITLHQFDALPGLPNASPSCMRLEAYLRLASIEYQTAPADLEAAPKGKAPYVAIDGRLMGDSALIIRHLNETRGIDLDAWLDARERAIGHAVQVMLQEHLYFAILHQRWFVEANWQIIKSLYFGAVPAASRDQVADQVRAAQWQKLEEQGLGKHTADEIVALGIADIDALAAILGDRDYLLGDRPTLADCTAHAHVANLIVPPLEGPLKEAAKGHANLVAYNRRMMERVFPEALAAAL